MTNSLGKRLTYRIMAVVLVMMAVIAGIVYYMVREYMLEEAQERYEGVLLRDHEEFRRRLSDVMVATNNHLYDIEQEVDEPEKIMPHLERILQVNPTILSTGILYSPDYFPGKPRCLELFASRDSAGVIHLGRIENDHNVNIDRAWYKKGIEQDTADWSEVYFENDLIPNVTGRRQLTTYAVPVHKDGRPVAIFGSDLPLEYLRSQLMDDLQAMHEKYERGCKTHSFSFVVDRDGTYIMHPDEERLLSGNFFEEVKHTSAKIDDDVLMSMINGENGSAMVELDGTHFAAPHSGSDRHESGGVSTGTYQGPTYIVYLGTNVCYL